jgi:tRNA G37 N-methylase Trm5
LESDPDIDFIKDAEIEINYDNFSMNECLKIYFEKYLNKNETLSEKDIPSGFETIGDIAHLNIKEKLLPFRFIVG